MLLLLLGGCSSMPGFIAGRWLSPPTYTVPPDSGWWETGGDVEPCDEPEATWLYPSGNQVHPASPLVAGFASHDCTEDLTLGAFVNGADSSALGGTSSCVDEDLMVLEPERALQGGEQGELWLMGECHDQISSFRTNLFGPPVDAPQDMLLQLYAVELQPAVMLRPAAVFTTYPALAQPLDPLLFQILDVQDDTMEIVMGRGEEAGRVTEQDVCAQTSRLQGAWESPVFTASGDLVLPGLERLGTWEQAELAVHFSPNGQSVGHMELTGLVRVDEAGVELTGQDICSTMSALGSPCVTCPSGTGQCLEVWISGLQAQARAPFDLSDVEQQWCHEDCQERDQHEECAG